eukprot:31547-Pelagococcus_subviridis.AAC.8
MQAHAAAGGSLLPIARIDRRAPGLDDDLQDLPHQRVRARGRLLRPRLDPARNPSEGRSIRSEVGVELKGVRSGCKYERTSTAAPNPTAAPSGFDPGAAAPGRRASARAARSPLSGPRSRPRSRRPCTARAVGDRRGRARRTAASATASRARTAAAAAAAARGETMLVELKGVRS